MPDLIASYVISLKDRIDRQKAFFAQLEGVSLQPQLIEAVTSSEVYTPFHENLAVAACWTSHQKVARYFLETNAAYALVFEDDAEISDCMLGFIESLTTEDLASIDCLQIGYNVFNGKIMGRKSDSFSRNRARISYLFHRRGRASVIKIAQEFVIMNAFETGTHCFLMNRKVARLILQINSPVVVPADVAFNLLTKMRGARVARLSRSLCQQSDSPSSIEIN